MHANLNDKRNWLNFATKRLHCSHI